MLKIIIQIFKNNVFERNTALVRKIILFDRLDNITRRKSLLNRQLGEPFARIRGMQGDGQMAFALFKKPF